MRFSAFLFAEYENYEGKVRELLLKIAEADFETFEEALKFAERLENEEIKEILIELKPEFLRMEKLKNLP